MDKKSSNTELQLLGLDQEKIEQMVVKQITDRLLSSNLYNYEDDEEYAGNSKLQKNLDSLIQKKIDEAVDRWAEFKIVPQLDTFIETLVLQQTDTWGQPKGEPMTLQDRVMQRAEKYINAEVDKNGNHKTDGDRYFSGTGKSRIAWMYEEKFYGEIQALLKEVVKDGRYQINQAIEGTIKNTLADMTKGFKLTVK